jgi:CelD/BcsL family acetyltransferase involved in cellulose biosynthesis
MKLIDDYKIDTEPDQLESIITSSSLADEEITTGLINSESGFDALEKEWSDLAGKADVHVFQSFEWQRLWWKHFGKKHQLHIITFRSNNDLVGIAPFYQEKTSLLFKFSYWRLRFIGCCVPVSEKSGTFLDYSPTDYLDIIAAPEYEDQIAGIFLLYLEKTGDHFNQVDFDEVSEDSFLMRKVVPAMADHGWSFKQIRMENCPRINLPETMDDYMLDLSGKTRYELRYSKRAVTEKGLFRVESVDAFEQVQPAFDEFVNLHQKIWNRLGLPGAFATPHYKNFLDDVTQIFYDRGWLRIKLAKKDEQCLAVDYAVMFNNRLYDYQKAFDDDSDLSKYGPGKTLFCELLDESIREKCTVFDMLRGNEKYKMRFANDSKWNWKVTIPNPEQKKGLKYRWYGFYLFFRKLYSRFGRERLIFQTHRKEWGVFRFLSQYTRFLKKRIRGKN